MAVVDQGAILRSGAALIPDLQQQLLQQQQLEIGRQQANTASLGLQQRLMEDQREQATANAYAADVARIGALPQAQQPQAIIALMQKYPKQSEALKRSWDAQDDAVKSADFKAAAEVYSFVQNGAPEKAAALLRKRIEADKAAGLDTADDEDIAIALESGDPAKIQQAASQIGWQLSTAAGPDKFASTYGALDGKKTEFEKQWDFIRGKYGARAANTYAQNRIDPVFPVTTQDGTTAFRSSQLMAGDAPSPIDELPQQAPTGSAPVSEDEGTQLLTQARTTKLITPEDLERIKAALQPQGHAAVDAYLKKFGIQVGREINGKRYVKRGNDWFEVN